MGTQIREPAKQTLAVVVPLSEFSLRAGLSTLHGK
jgi:hypothetical protein